jgi:hypothetical protein
MENGQGNHRAWGCAHSLFAGNEQLYRKAVINKSCRIPKSGLSPIDELQAGFLFHVDIMPQEGEQAKSMLSLFSQHRQISFPVIDRDWEF